MNILSIGVAFAAGLVSFFSPCVLPIIPGFLAYLAGTSLGSAETKRAEVFLNALFFVLGFSFIFSLLGVLLNSLLSSVAFAAQSWLSRIGGIVIVFFGIYLTGLLRIPLLEREYKIAVSPKFRSRYFNSFIFGAAFAIGWSPCVGAVLGGILALAATRPGLAFSLLFAYSLGLGVPFLLVGFFAAPAASWIRKYRPAWHLVDILFGLILVGLGILVFTGSLSLISNFKLLDQFLGR